MAAQTSSVLDAVMNDWLAQTLALKPGKRAKWKGVLVNQTGTRSVIRYDTAGLSVAGFHTHFVQKLNEERKGKRGTDDDWIPVFSFSQRAALVEAQARLCKHVVVATPDGARPAAYDDHLQNVHFGRLGRTLASLRIDDSARPFEGDSAAMREQICAQVGENATGNHTARNHSIRVRTAAGEPVRG